MKKKICFILFFLSVITFLPLGSVYATDSNCVTTRCVAIDASRITSYSPSFDTAKSSLEEEGYTVNIWRDGEITAERLACLCVLIIVMPQVAYSDTEIAIILDFVNNGHGLLFLGDYGATWKYSSGGIYPEAADPIISPFGISINNDLIRDPTDFIGDTGWPKVHIFPVTHPITDGISIYVPAASATLEINTPAIAIATGDDDTTVETVEIPPYPPAVPAPYEPVLAASKYGMGRAVVAGDHNWIVDLWINYENNIQLLLNIVNWLCTPTPNIVSIDIKPGSFPNSINLESKGVVPVAVLTDENFDANTVDPSTVTFAGAAPLHWAFEDVDDDGDIDLILKFKIQELELTQESTEAILTGETIDGGLIEGTDTVNIVPS